MEEFKIKMFYEEHKVEFPTYRTLSQDECKTIRLELIQKYAVEQENMVYELFLKQNYYPDEDATESFNLIYTLNKLGIVPLEDIYIDWYNFEKIDLMNINNLSNFFYDIWFPVADDINIFDENLDWLVFIRHDGAIYFMKN